MTAPAVRRLQNDLTRLRKARAEGERDHKDLRKDSNLLRRQVKQLAAHRKEGDADHKALDRAGAQLKKDVDAFSAQMKPLEQQKNVLDAQLAADTFDYDAFAPGVQQNPALLQQLAEVEQKRADTAAKWDPKLQAGRDAKAKFANEIVQDRAAINQDLKAISHSRAVVKHDHREIKHDRSVNARLRKVALKHLRPAEYKMGLQATNRARHELGLSRVSHVIRPINLHTVKGCAQFLLDSKNVSFWSGLSTGSDRKNVERLARGERAYVPATGGYVTPKLSMMKALVAMAKRGHIQINALTGGIHSTGSNHYRGTAVDLDLSNQAMAAQVARQYGGYRNSETSHQHFDF